jgi:predicted nuclease of restriction endonuclease-like (RecB) superfamily
VSQSASNPPPTNTDADYQRWLVALKQSFRQRQLKAAVAVNRELLAFYWQLGSDIVHKQSQSQWGDGFLARLSDDLINEFPQVKGFSLRNLKYIRQWVGYWQPLSQQPEFGQQLVAQLTAIPWGHNLLLVSKCQSSAEACFYLGQCQQQGWSRAVLTHQIDSQLWQRQGQAVSNFAETLPPAQSDLAQQSLKDPYVFDFLTLTADYNERELEQSLTQHITQFLLELGAGFAYVGKQVPLQVGDQDFYLDLLFYHTRLHCYVVVELKVTDFKPEYAGKLNFYINAVDGQIKTDHDQPTIGLLLCQTKDKLIAEYALKGISTPIGVSEYQLQHALPPELESQLPSIEQIERELGPELAAKGDKP